MELPAAQAQSRSPAGSWSAKPDWHQQHPVPTDPDPASNNTVILRLPASSAYLSILRTATAGLAALLQFTLDEIEDLRIAVDEACAVLLASHPAPTRIGDQLTSDTVLTCTFTLHAQHIEVEVALPVITDPEQIAPSQHSFAWQVLRALTDDVETYADATTLAIRLAKRRAAP